MLFWPTADSKTSQLDDAMAPRALADHCQLVLTHLYLMDDIDIESKAKELWSERSSPGDGLDWKWERRLADATHVPGTSNQRTLTLTYSLQRVFPSRAATHNRIVQSVCAAVVAA